MESDTTAADAGSPASGRGVDWLGRARFRATPERRLVAYVAAPPDGSSDDDFGVLAGGQGPPQGVSCDTALLLYTLSEPGPLPNFARSSLLRHRARALCGLLFSGVLEVELDGRFVTGAEAAVVLGDVSTLGATRVELLTRQAVTYGAATRLVELSALSDRLYRYNSTPSTPAIERIFGADPISERLGARSLRGWHHHADDAWHWFSPEADRGAHPRWKLYASPTLDDLAPSLDELSAGFAGAHALQWKVARGVEVIRPDRVVAYFATRDDLLEAAGIIRARLAGIRAQGVPFAVPIDREGLLGWGVDPAVGTLPARQSWRLYVVRQVSELLAGAAGGGGDAGTEARVVEVFRGLHVAGLDGSTLEPSPGWLEEYAA